MHFSVWVFKKGNTLLVKKTTPAGFEPARAKPNRFLIYRLNHSATVSKLLNNMVMLHSKSKSVGAWGESNPRPLAPEARIIPLDHKPTLHMKCETDFFLLSITCIIIYLSVVCPDTTMFLDSDFQLPSFGWMVTIRVTISVTIKVVGVKTNKNVITR